MSKKKRKDRNPTEKVRDPHALNAKTRHAGYHRHKNDERGGAKNLKREWVHEYTDEHSSSGRD